MPHPDVLWTAKSTIAQVTGESQDPYIPAVDSYLSLGHFRSITRFTVVAGIMDVNSSEEVSADLVSSPAFFKPVLPLSQISPERKSAWRRVPRTDFCQRFGFSSAFAVSDLFEQVIFSNASTLLSFLRDTSKDAVGIDWKVLNLNEDLPNLPPTAVDDVVYTWMLLRALSNDDKKTVLRHALPLSQPTKRPRSSAVVRRAFDMEEHGNTFSTRPSLGVYRRICQYNQSWTSIHYLSPYTSIVGPSGIGKSYIVSQLARQHKAYVVYISLAVPRSSGYPRRSPLADFISNINFADMALVGEEERMKFDDTSAIMVENWKQLILVCYLEVLACIKIGISPSQFYNMQLDEDQEPSYAVRLLDLVKCPLRRHTPSASTISRDLLDRAQDFINSRARALQDLVSLPCNQMDSDSQSSNASAAPTMILCLDEARALLGPSDSSDHINNITELSSFRAFRRAARECRDYVLDGNQCDFFALLLDTNSKVANFSPAAAFDPSQKVKSDSAANLYPPIYTINTFDSFALKGVALGLNGSPEALATMLRYGRPLWGALLDSGLQIHEVVNLADSKTTLSRGSPVRWSSSEHLLWMSHRVTLYVSQYSLAEFLVAQGMRYPLYINDNRTMLSTVQPSEPILSFVASRRMLSSSLRLASLRTFISALHIGSVNVGDVGEVVAALVLQFSMDCIFFKENKRGPTAFDSVKVSSFFRSLVGDSNHARTVDWLVNGTDCVGLRTLWSDGRIYFNHVIRVTSLSDRPLWDIEHAYRRGAALFLPNNFPGADIIIPVLLPNKTFSYILVQVKNRKADNMRRCQACTRASIESAAEDLRKNGHSPKVPYIGLFMSLRQRDGAQSEFAICGQSTPTTSRMPDNCVDSLLMIGLGLDEKLYPSCFPDGSQERLMFYDCLRQLRDSQPQAVYPDHPDHDYLNAMSRYLQVY
ncbi:hypothetical protein KEM54_005802 [Ascosphaera aggregata]|nr:hypothetical protein KEM54_005802 [Ascosphaera aggregata]